MELLVIALWSFAVALAGGVAGLVLGNMRLPVLLQFASSPAAGAGANVAVSGLSALTASIAHWRGGRIDWRLFWLMAPPSLLGGVLGGVLSGILPQRFLLAAIAVVVLFGAYEISRRDRFASAGERPGVDWNLLAAGACGAIPGAYLGAQLTGKLDDDALLRVIAVILVIAGLVLGVEALLG